MPKMRRAWMIVGVLMLIGCVHSYVTSMELLGHRGDVIWGFFSERDGWAVAVFKQQRYVMPEPPTLRLAVVNISARGGEFWRIDIGGGWLFGAILALAPSLALEIRARRRRHIAGFEVLPKKNPAHTGGVNTSRAV